MKASNNSVFWKEFVENGRLGSTFIIDCHTHMGDIAGASEPIYTVDECVDLMAQENIDSIWCAPHSDIFGVENVNVEIEKYMQKYPNKVKGYFGFNPNYKELYLILNKILEIEGYIGLKFLPVYHNTALDSENYIAALEFADKYNLVVLSHTWGKTACSPKEVESILKKYKNLQFILGHSAPNQLDEAIEVVKKYDNAILDLCDIHRHSGIVDKMANSVGAERIVFGTDLPWYDPNYCIGSILCSKLSDDDKEKIFNKNALRILKNINKKRY